MIQLSDAGIITIIVIGSLVFVAGLILLYFFVILPMTIKKQILSLRKRYSYLDAKLIGQDTQYFHRIEVISRTNLLYLDKYELFSRRFKGIFENEDKYCESMLKQLDSLVVAKQFKGIKKVIDSTKKSIDVFEESVNAFDADLYEVIRLEEDCRKKIDSSKETYRHIKQTYYTENSEIEMVAQSFAKAFEKIDATFARLDDLIESAEYEEINASLPELNSVLNALGRVLLDLPTLCSLTKTVVVEKMSECQAKFREVEKNGLPVYQLSFKSHMDDWKKRLNELNKRLINLQTYGVKTECELIMTEIANMNRQLDDEISSKDYFNSHYQDIYNKVNEVEKVFVKLCAILPQVKEFYKIDEEEKNVSELSVAVGNLTNAKRFLEGFVYSGIRQPYSLLKKQLDELNANYEVVEKGVNEFKVFIDSLKGTAEEAYKLIFVYYSRMKEAENTLKEIGVDSLTNSYKEKIDAVYEVLNDLYVQLQAVPIDVDEISNRIEQLKNLANRIFDEVDDKVRESALAEQTIVLLNRDINDTNVAQAQETFEAAFNKGDFKEAYSQANLLYNSSRVE